MSDLATRFLVPSIDVGVMPEGLNGKVTAQFVEITVTRLSCLCILFRQRQHLAAQGGLHDG